MHLNRILTIFITFLISYVWSQTPNQPSQSVLAQLKDEFITTIEDQKMKIENYLNLDKFWGLVGYEQYHESAIIFDYQQFIHDQSSGLNGLSFKRYIPLSKSFISEKISEIEDKNTNESNNKLNCNKNEIHCKALERSIDILSEDFYQSKSTDIKFVSLSSQNTEIKSTEESVICVSGFLSQRDNLRDAWHSVLDRVGEEKNVLGFKWPAEDILSIFNRILLEISNIRFTNISHISIGDIMAFNGVREIAKESGRLLAHALILEYPDYLPSVNFISFSLGTEVVRSCLEELHTLGAKNIVKDVYLMGGATTIEEKDYKIFDVISGKLVHVYTPRDRILDFYELATAQIPIGQDKLDQNLVEKIEKMGIDVEQYDITGISNGHTKYRSYLDEILETINFE